MKLRHLAPVAASLVLLSAAVAADAPKPAAAVAADPSKAEGRFKNIQALKGTPADDVFPAMQFISAALGVDCDFCHVEHAPEKDDKKEKQTARKMIAMTFAINREHFDGHREVTCVSCHRGSPRPHAIPAIAEGEPKEEAEAEKPAELPAAGAVLDKYVQSVGGADAIAKVSSRVQKGKLTGFGPDPVPVDVSTKAPDKRITTVHNQRGDNITAFDGQAGWLGNTGRPARDMTAAESDAARLDAALLFPSDPKKLFKDFKVAPPEKIEGKDAVHVIAMNEGKPPAELWFDAQSGLLVRLVRYAETPLGRNPTQIDYADYRDSDGVKVPFRWTVARPSGRFTIQIDESKQNVTVDDKTFQKPSPPPQPPPS
jgi:photosynthetic reaction center cytochrome c subunit